MTQPPTVQEIRHRLDRLVDYQQREVFGVPLLEAIGKGLYGTLDPAAFGHAEHVRVGWYLLEESRPAVAAVRLVADDDVATRAEDSKIRSYSSSSVRTTSTAREASTTCSVGPS